MAASLVERQVGYEDALFFGQRVRDSLHCSICLNVLREPKMCQREHVFCKACISQHLEHNHNCPECREMLTMETLREPTRFLMEIWSELQVKCDFYDHGCINPVQLGVLNDHVAVCGFAPVQCSNEGCGMVVNRQDLENHERELCRFRLREVKCKGCEEVEKEVGEIKDEMRRYQDHVFGELEQLKLQDAALQEMLHKTLEKMNTSLEAVKASDCADELKRNQTRLMRDMQQQEVQQPSTSNTNFKQAAIRKLNNNDILIFGGYTTGWNLVESGERFSWVTSEWSELPQMNGNGATASCFVIGKDVFICGGSNGLCRKDDIKVLKSEKEPLVFQQIQGKLPEKSVGHQTVVCAGKVILTCGEVGGFYTSYLNDFSELQLDRSPCSRKVLAKMTEGRAYHGSVVIGNKVFCLGGKKCQRDVNTLDSVCVFDLVSNQCKEMPALSYAVCQMSTVVCEARILVIGGLASDGNVINTVISYNPETGESEMLPPMKYKRYGCSAVAVADGVVVMGGINEKKIFLNSVEYLNMNTRVWQEFPPMTKPRLFACAVVKP